MKYTYSCIIAVIAMSCISTLTQAKTDTTWIFYKPTAVEVQCNDWGWTGAGHNSIRWRNYCSTLSVRKNGTITDKINVKDDCDNSASGVVYSVTFDKAPKFYFKMCANLEGNSNPYSQSR